jgi:hypothetical protein
VDRILEDAAAPRAMPGFLASSSGGAAISAAEMIRVRDLHPVPALGSCRAIIID